MSSERQAFNDGFDKGYAKAQERIAQLENKVMKLHGTLDILEAKNERLYNLAYSYELDVDGNRLTYRALEADKDMIKMELEAENKRLREEKREAELAIASLALKIDNLENKLSLFDALKAGDDDGLA